MLPSDSAVFLFVRWFHLQARVGSPFGFYSTSFRSNNDQILTSCARKFDRFAANRIGGSAIKRTESTPILVNAIVFASNEPTDQGARLGPARDFGPSLANDRERETEGRFSKYIASGAFISESGTRCV